MGSSEEAVAESAGPHAFRAQSFAGRHRKERREAISRDRMASNQRREGKSGRRARNGMGRRGASNSSHDPVSRGACRLAIKRPDNRQGNEQPGTKGSARTRRTNKKAGKTIFPMTSPWLSAETVERGKSLKLT